MYLENLVFDAVDPRRLGRFWEAVVGGERLTDEPEGYETRLAVAGGPELDLCFQRVAAPSTEPPRLHLDLAAGTGQVDEVARLLGDPEGNPFRLLEHPAAYAGTGPLAAIRLDAADPDEAAGFWSWLTGWTDPTGVVTHSLRHPSQLGPVLGLCPESAPKGPTKNRIHLDVRLEAGDDSQRVAAGIVERGGRELRTDWGNLPWVSYTDPSGNEFCVLPARR